MNPLYDPTETEDMVLRGEQDGRNHTSCFCERGDATEVKENKIGAAFHRREDKSAGERFLQ